MSDFFIYLRLGFDHITDPSGYDHILFVIALCAVYTLNQWRQVLILVTAFTIGHSITLALATLNLITYKSDLIELLNTQFNLNLTIEQRETYARKLGSDCAFFIQNRPQYCVEKGDVFEEIALDLSGYHMLLVYPNLAISTAEAYTGVTPRQPSTLLRKLLEAPIDTWRGRVHNEFEDSLFPKYPVLADLKQHLYDLGAIYASMSGSGSTVYGIFSAPPERSDFISRYTIWTGKLS